MCAVLVFEGRAQVAVMIIYNSFVWVADEL